MHHLFVSRAGDSLVNVTQNRNTYRLLANFDGTNVILLQIDAGSVVWLTPDPERPVYLEYYTLLTGELTLHTDEGEAQTLCAGDSFTPPASTTTFPSRPRRTCGFCASPPSRFSMISWGLSTTSTI